MPSQLHAVQSSSVSIAVIFAMSSGSAFLTALLLLALV